MSNVISSYLLLATSRHIYLSYLQCENNCDQENVILQVTLWSGSYWNVASSTHHHFIFSSLYEILHSVWRSVYKEMITCGDPRILLFHAEELWITLGDFKSFMPTTLKPSFISCKNASHIKGSSTSSIPFKGDEQKPCKKGRRRFSIPKTSYYQTLTYITVYVLKLQVLKFPNDNISFCPELSSASLLGHIDQRHICILSCPLFSTSEKHETDKHNHTASMDFTLSVILGLFGFTLFKTVVWLLTEHSCTHGMESPAPTAMP